MIRFNVTYHVFITNFDQFKSFMHPEFELRVSRIEHGVTALTTVSHGHGPWPVTRDRDSFSSKSVTVTGIVTKKLQSRRALLPNRYEAPKLNHHIMIVL